MSLPRRLRPDEIARILEAIPLPKSFDEEAAILSVINLRLELETNYLPLIEICEEDVDTYAKEMAKIINSSFIEEGSPVGANGSMSLSSAITQSTMKTYNMASGESGKLQSGIKQLDSLLKIQKEVPEPRMTIHFNTMVTVEDVMEIRRSIEQITIADLVTKIVIGRAIDVNKKYWWHELNENVSTYMNNKKVCARIYLNYDKMYEHRLLPTKVKEAMEISFGKEDRSNHYLLVASPLVASNEEGETVYCVIDALYVQELENVDKIEFMYQRNLTAGFGLTCVKGMLGVTTVVPKTISMHTLFLKERKLYAYEKMEGDRNVEAIDINYKVMSSVFSVSLNYLRDELSDAGIEIVREVDCPTLGSLKAFKDNPHLRISTFIVKKRKESSYETLVKRKTNYVYAVTYGANIRDLSRLPIVDITRVSSNDARQIQKFYGVEVAYANHLMLLYNALGDVSSRDVDSRHIMLLMDIMFASEQAAGISYHGSRGRGADYIEIAAMSSAPTVFTTAAMGRLTSKRTVNTSILQGSLMPFGSKERRKRIIQSKVDARNKKLSTLDMILSETGSWEGTSSTAMTNIVETKSEPLVVLQVVHAVEPPPRFPTSYDKDIEKYIGISYSCSLADRSNAIKFFLSADATAKEALVYSSVVKTAKGYDTTGTLRTSPSAPRYIITIKMADELTKPFVVNPSTSYLKLPERAETKRSVSTFEQPLDQLYLAQAYFLRR